MKILSKIQFPNSLFSKLFSACASGRTRKQLMKSNKKNLIYVSLNSNRKSLKKKKIHHLSWPIGHLCRMSVFSSKLRLRIWIKLKAPRKAHLHQSPTRKKIRSCQRLRRRSRQNRRNGKNQRRNMGDIGCLMDWWMTPRNKYLSNALNKLDM